MSKNADYVFTWSGVRVFEEQKGFFLSLSVTSSVVKMVAKKGGGRGGADDAEEELARIPLQAIVLADSFTTKFRPITLERPKVKPSPSYKSIFFFPCIFSFYMLVLTEYY